MIATNSVYGSAIGTGGRVGDPPVDGSDKGTSLIGAVLLSDSHVNVSSDTYGAGIGTGSTYGNWTIRVEALTVVNSTVVVTASRGPCLGAGEVWARRLNLS
jgi:hypothetical protein